MSAIAVIIGIDDYTFAPLTSAVRDALQVRDALVALGLVAAREVVLLTDPPQSDGAAATRMHINASLKQVYDRGSRYERLYFFYAGHGLSGYVDAAHSVTQTLLVPSDVSELAGDVNLLINFDDLRQRLERAGPAQQFMFFDACRDLLFDEHPVNLPTMGWSASAAPATGSVAQSTLFAVSPGGKALGVADGMGVMTEHLIDALHGRGVALDWSDSDASYVITAQSIARHVRARVEAAAGTHLQWRHQIMVPEARDVGGPLAPIRVVADPPPASLTLVYEPADAHVDTEVTLTLRGQAVADPKWPPNCSRKAAPAGWHAYRICPTNPRHEVYAEPERIDLREQQSATILRGVAPFGPAASNFELGPGDGIVHVPMGVASGRALTAHASVQAETSEPGARIELVGTDPPYDRWERAARFSEQVRPGSYVMRFRQGTEVYSEAALDLATGQRVLVEPGASRSPLLSEAGLPDHDGSVYVSSTAGRVRSGTLSTVLTLLGLAPFGDVRASQPSRFPPMSLDEARHYGHVPVRVMIAVEGSGWPLPAHEIAEQLRCDLIASEGGLSHVRLSPVAHGQGGWARIAHGTGRAPGRSFTVRIASPWTGTIEIASAALARRVTVVSLALTPDGHAELVQHVLRLPGEAYPEPVPYIQPDRFLRELVLGERLYASGELLQTSHIDASSRGSILEQIESLLYAKWTDPILGCMAYLALAEAASSGGGLIRTLPAGGDLAVPAGNLFRYFADLPDARVIAAHARVAGAPRLAEALSAGEAPVLAQTLRLLASEPGPHQAEYLRRVRSISPPSPWTLEWRPDTGVVPTDRTPRLAY